MKRKIFSLSFLSYILLILLVAALAFSMVACSDKEDEKRNVGEESLDGSETEVGEGERTFIFKVVFKDGSKRTYKVNTDREILADALLEADLIAGDDDTYGLYVKTVAGETLDWNTDGKYWALYENDAYATGGVSSTTITEGVVYSFVAS